MAYNLLSCERDQSYLMPPSMRDWLSEGHLAWFIVDAVGQMDLREFYAVYRSDGWGAAAYDPGMMVAILLYGYCVGVRSSRRIARALEEDVGFRVVAANAALATNRSHQAIEEEVRRMLAEAKAMDAEEDANYGPDRRGDELPEGLGGRTERLKRLKEAKERLQREAEAGAKAVQEHVERRRAEEEATGKKKRGRKPKVVEPLPTEEAKANTTDPDSRIMKTRQGYVQGYNAQAVVSEEQIIVAVGVTQEANDVQQLEPMLQTMAHTLEAAGIEDRPKAGLADAGYWSEANIRACPWPEMPELLIATTKDWKQRKMLREKGCPRGRIPKGLSPRDRMERKLLTKRGRSLYKKRGVLVEPVFGQVKEGQGFRRFMRRGLGAAQSEWSLAGTTHNLLKLWRSGQAPWPKPKAPWN